MTLRQDGFLEKNGLNSISAWDDTKKPSSEEIFEFYIQVSSSVIFLFSLAVYNSFGRLPAHTTRTPPLAVVSQNFVSQNLSQPLPSGLLECTESALRQTVSSSSALSVSQTGPRSHPYSSSSSEDCLYLAKSKFLVGTSVRLPNQFTIPTRAILRVNANKEKPDSSLSWQGDPGQTAKTVFEALQDMTKKDTTLFQTFIADNPVTDRNRVRLIRKTNTKLTDCTLNSLQELEIYYPFMTQTFNYFDMNASLFSKKEEYDLLDEGIVWTQYFLTSHLGKSDSFVNSTRHHLGLLKSNPNQPSSQEEWPIEWQNAWRNTFEKVKLKTAIQLEHVKQNALGDEFQEENADLYCLAANVSSISHLYLIEKSAKAFQLFFDAEPADCIIQLKDVLSESDALFENESLDAYFERNYSAYYESLKSKDSFSTPFEKLCAAKRKHKRPQYMPKKGLCYPDVEFIRAQNLELFKLPVLSDELFL